MANRRRRSKNRERRNSDNFRRMNIGSTPPIVLSRLTPLRKTIAIYKYTTMHDGDFKQDLSTNDLFSDAAGTSKYQQVEIFSVRAWTTNVDWRFKEDMYGKGLAGDFGSLPWLQLKPGNQSADMVPQWEVTGYANSMMSRASVGFKFPRVTARTGWVRSWVFASFHTNMSEVLAHVDCLFF